MTSDNAELTRKLAEAVETVCGKGEGVCDRWLCPQCNAVVNFDSFMGNCDLCATAVDLVVSTVPRDRAETRPKLEEWMRRKGMSGELYLSEGTPDAATMFWHFPDGDEVDESAEDEETARDLAALAAYEKIMEGT